MTVLPRNYRELGPTIMDPEVTHSYVEEILEVAERIDHGVIEIAEALYEMGVRLSDQYQIFSKDESIRITNWIIANWNDKEIEADSLIPLFYMIDPREEALNCLNKIFVSSKNPLCGEKLVEIITEIK